MAQNGVCIKCPDGTTSSAKSIVCNTLSQNPGFSTIFANEIVLYTSAGSAGAVFIVGTLLLIQYRRRRALKSDKPAQLVNSTTVDPVNSSLKETVVIPIETAVPHTTTATDSAMVSTNEAISIPVSHGE